MPYGCSCPDKSHHWQLHTALGSTCCNGCGPPPPSHPHVHPRAPHLAPTLHQKPGGVIVFYEPPAGRRAQQAGVAVMHGPMLYMPSQVCLHAHTAHPPCRPPRPPTHFSHCAQIAEKPGGVIVVDELSAGGHAQQAGVTVGDVLLAVTARAQVCTRGEGGWGVWYRKVATD
jgi:hypothetical protein